MFTLDQEQLVALWKFLDNQDELPEEIQDICAQMSTVCLPMVSFKKDEPVRKSSMPQFPAKLPEDLLGKAVRVGFVDCFAKDGIIIQHGLHAHDLKFWCPGERRVFKIDTSEQIIAVGEASMNLALPVV